MTTLKPPSLKAAGVLLIAARLFAHHSFNVNYDTARETQVTGTLFAVDWRNPHVLLETRDSSGATWAADGPAPVWFKKHGVPPTAFKARVGQIVTLAGFPAKEAQRELFVRRVVFSDGSSLDLSGSSESAEP